MYIECNNKRNKQWKNTAMTANSFGHHYKTELNNMLNAFLSQKPWLWNRGVTWGKVLSMNSLCLLDPNKILEFFWFQCGVRCFLFVDAKYWIFWEILLSLFSFTSASELSFFAQWWQSLGCCVELHCTILTSIVFSRGQHDVRFRVPLSSGPFQKNLDNCFLLIMM